MFEIFDKSNISSYSKIIFDIDGTILDTEKFKYEELLKLLNLSSKPDELNYKNLLLNDLLEQVLYSYLITTRLKSLIKKYISLKFFKSPIFYVRFFLNFHKINKFHLDDELPLNLINSSEKLIQECVTLKKDIIIMTNRKTSEIKFISSFLKEKYSISTFLSSDLIGYEKPDVRFFESLKRNDCIYVGDSWKDILACQKANIPLILVDKGFWPINLLYSFTTKIVKNQLTPIYLLN